MEYNSAGALAVAQELLDVTGHALRKGDFVTFVECFAIPHILETFEGQRVIDTAEELRGVFEAVRAHHKSSGVTEMARHCVAAAFKDPETIDTVHETRMVSGAMMTQSPFPAYSVLKHNGERWQVAKCTYAIANSPRHNQALMGSAISASKKKA